MLPFKFITDAEIYKQVLLEKVPHAKEYLWIATANIKNLYIERGDSYVPFLKLLEELIKNKVNISLIHAKEAGPSFRKEFDKHPALIKNIERMVCPRLHFKCIIVDGNFAYTGSANLTGAGMGAKGPNRRNFENGIITTDLGLIQQLRKQFLYIWTGKKCKECERKEYCTEIKLTSCNKPKTSQRDRKESKK